MASRKAIMLTMDDLKLLRAISFLAGALVALLVASVVLFVFMFAGLVPRLPILVSFGIVHLIVAAIAAFFQVALQRVVKDPEREP